MPRGAGGRLRRSRRGLFHEDRQAALQRGEAEGEVILGIRPEDMTPCEPSEAWFTGTVVVVERLGSASFGYIETDDGRSFAVTLDRDTDLVAGARLSARGNPDAIHLFDAMSEQRLN